jgi:hypothetical protein
MVALSYILVGLVGFLAHIIKTNYWLMKHGFIPSKFWNLPKKDIDNGKTN